MRPGERHAARMRAHADETIGREIPAMADMVAQAFASLPLEEMAVLELLDAHEPGNSDVHDAVMTLVFLHAFDDAGLAAVMHHQLGRLVRAERPGTPRWQALVRLSGIWRGQAQTRADRAEMIRARNNPYTAPKAGGETPCISVVEDEIVLPGDDAPEDDAPDMPGEERIGVLDGMVPRNADRMSEVEPFQALIDGVALRRFRLDIDEIVAALRKEFPWFAALIDDIESEWRLAGGMGRGWIHVRPILLHGPPGIGKSRFVARLAELSGTGHGFLSVAGSSDNRQLAGTAAGWSTAMPSWPAQMMLKHGCANPILMVDELDKTSEERRNGRVIDTLLTMIEPETGRMWNDECLGGALDLTHVSWLMCANDLSLIDPTLRSRVRCIAVDGPDVSNFTALYQRMLTDIACEFGTDPALLPALADPAVAALAEGFEQTRSIRRLRRALEIALGQQIRSERARPN